MEDDGMTPPTSTLRGVVAVSPMAATLIRYDEHGRPMYASDPRLGNRKTRRRLLREQRQLIAARSS